MPPTLLILLAVAFPLAGAGVLIIGSMFNSRGDGAGVTQLACLGTITSLGILLVQHITGTAALPPPLVFGDGALAQLVPKGARFTWELDTLALVWILVSSTLILTLTMGRRLSVPVFKRSTCIFALLFLATCFLIMLADDAWWQWCSIVLNTWLLAGVIWTAGSQSKAISHGPFIVSLVVADLFWMLGILGAFNVLGTYVISEFTVPESFSRLSPYEHALVGIAGMWMMGSLILRTGMFPAMGWAASITHTPRSTLLMLLPVIISMALLFRFHSMLTSDVGLRTFMGGVATLSVVFLPVMTFGNQSPAQRLLRITVASLAMVWLSLAADPEAVSAMQRYAVSLIAFAVVIGLHLEMPKQRLGKALAIVAAVVWGSGFFGQGQVLNIISGTAKAQNGVTLPGSVPTLILFSHGMICFSLYRLLSPLPETTTSKTSLAVTIRTPLYLPFALLLIPVAWEIGTPFYHARQVVFPIPVRCLLFGAFGAVVAYLLQRQAQRFPEQSTAPTSLVRLSENELYTPLILQNLFVVPIRVLVTLIVMVEEEVFQRILPNLWTSQTNNSSVTSAPEASRLVLVVMAVLVMCAAIILAEVL